jgi:hypothetical protein
MARDFCQLEGFSVIPKLEARVNSAFIPLVLSEEARREAAANASILPRVQGDTVEITASHLALLLSGEAQSLNGGGLKGPTFIHHTGKYTVGSISAVFCLIPRTDSAEPEPIPNASSLPRPRRAFEEPGEGFVVGNPMYEAGVDTSLA